MTRLKKLLLNIISLKIILTQSENLNKEEIKKSYYLLEDLQIKSPLPNDQRFLGWYVDGEWKVKNKEISFIDYKEKAFLITNNLVFTSEKLIFDLDMTIKEDFSKSAKDKNLVKTSEVLFFNFGERIYRIKQFDAYSTRVYLEGITVFLFRHKGSNIFFLKDFKFSENYNLQMVFNENYTTDGRLYCKQQYKNKRNKIKFSLDFINKKFNVYINDILCIQYEIPKNSYENHKSTLTFSGYSTSLAPLKINLHECSIYKYTASYNDSFHSNIETFNQALNTLNPRHEKNSSLSNILLVQGKIKKEIGLTKEILELMAKRTQNIELSIKNQTKVYKNNTNMFYDNMEYADKLRSQVRNIHYILNSNKQMENSFKEIKNGFADVEKLFKIISDVDDINDNLSQLDQMLEINDFEVLLEELNEMGEIIKQNNLYFEDDITGKIINKLNKKFRIWGGIKVFAVFILIFIFLLVWKIVQILKEKMKEDLF